ncbi:hypothetical protein KD933_gp39 [Mycobacterium phage Rebel]|nr:hypothetical protein KD933_gp39 [Mycobacterium phage Rebel]QKY78947.1 hypothetical protein SEA_REBEL_39 [Mycobacterium phage Rebel]
MRRYKGRHRVAEGRPSVYAIRWRLFREDWTRAAVPNGGEAR